MIECKPTIGVHEGLDIVQPTRELPTVARMCPLQSQGVPTGGAYVVFPGRSPVTKLCRSMQLDWPSRRFVATSRVGRSTVHLIIMMLHDEDLPHGYRGANWLAMGSFSEWPIQLRFYLKSTAFGPGRLDPTETRTLAGWARCTGFKTPLPRIFVSLSCQGAS